MADPDQIDDLAVETENGKKFLPLRFRSEGRMLDLEEVIVWGPVPDALIVEANAILLETGYSVGRPLIRMSRHLFGEKPNAAGRSTFREP